MRLRMTASLVGLALLAPAVARADVKPHALVREGMVLQQRTDARVWGKADPGEEVTVTFRDQKATAKADDKGDWRVTIQAGAAGGPFALTIAGKNTITYKDVLVGEVWVCSGQSNMEWSVDGCDQSDKEYAHAAPHNPKLRLFHVRKLPTARPIDETAGKWVEADPKTVGGWTAVGYFFGRDLQDRLKVPVGLIQSAWGGTDAEAWTSPEALEASLEYKGAIDAFRAKTKDHPATKGVDPNAPSALYNGMIHPILNYRIRGAVWYQGENNTGRAYAYRELFPMLIQDWRKHWQEPDFPFYFVQLAPFTAAAAKPGPSSWAELREAQLRTLKLPGTGMAVITDLGNEYDIHPTPKRPVGERLALIARAKVYGEKLEYSGPEYIGMKVEGGKAVLSFSHTGGGLVAHELVPTLERKGNNGKTMAAWRVKEKSEGGAPLVGFAVAGEDQVFHPAKAEIVGDLVVVSSNAVAQPVAVRYGWADHPICNLFNRAGLPASPFRTDQYPGQTGPKR